MSRVFFSGFETGDFSEASSGPFGAGTAAVQSSIVRSGNYAAQFTGAKFYGFGNFSLSAIYYGISVYLSALPSIPGSLISTVDAGAANDIVNVVINTDGTLSCYNGGTLLGTGTATVTPGIWTRLELKVVIDASAGIVELKVDGAIDQTYTGLTTNAHGNVAAVALETTGSTGIDIYFDDMIVDNSSYPGSGKIIARQGTAGTPTYDSWTKVGAATAALCWSDTPCSTAQYCDDSNLSDKQTMLVWPFNTVQTGHGSDTVGPVDTINAAKVSTIAKSASAGNMDILFRYGGSDNATTVTLTTSDAYYESSYLTPTVANVNASEIGATNDLTSVLTTVEDCWLQVDYTPFTNYAAIWPYGV